MRKRNADEYGFITVTIATEDGETLHKLTIEPKQGSARQRFMADKVKEYLDQEYRINTF